MQDSLATGGGGDSSPRHWNHFRDNHKNCLPNHHSSLTALHGFILHRTKAGLQLDSITRLDCFCFVLSVPVRCCCCSSLCLGFLLLASGQTFLFYAWTSSVPVIPQKHCFKKHCGCVCICIGRAIVGGALFVAGCFKIAFPHLVLFLKGYKRFALLTSLLLACFRSLTVLHFLCF